MRIRNRTASLLLVLSLLAAAAVVPATALGQSAGDEQYVDPFQDDNSGGGNQGDSGNSAPQDEAPATEAPATTAPADTAGTTAAQEGGNGDTRLPRTGSPTAAVGLIGVMLVAGGIALRRAWPLPD
jgi:LPXTG-motif cell wall-anchored protein